jgi:hypothetical protein
MKVTATALLILALAASASAKRGTKTVQARGLRGGGDDCPTEKNCLRQGSWEGAPCVENLLEESDESACEYVKKCKGPWFWEDGEPYCPDECPSKDGYYATIANKSQPLCLPECDENEHLELLSWTDYEDAGDRRLFDSKRVLGEKKQMFTYNVQICVSNLNCPEENKVWVPMNKHAPEQKTQVCVKDVKGDTPTKPCESIQKCKNTYPYCTDKCKNLEWKEDGVFECDYMDDGDKEEFECDERFGKYYGWDQPQDQPLV